VLSKVIRFFLENKLVTVLVLLLCVGWGIATAPFNWKVGLFPRSPVPVDAIPDLGENQQIVYTEWPGRSPQDVEDQITYPLTTALLGIPGVKTIRSNSIFGLSSIYIIFDDKIDFYWSRTRILEKLNSLSAGILPQGVTPALGPDATALGQIFWYTLEGRDDKGRPAGGWDPQELRTIQDYYVRYALSTAKGVSEVASIGGFVKEYQIDINPDAMKAYHVNIAQIMEAVKKSNLDIGARTIEVNLAEYLVRALGYVKNIDDLEESVVAVNDNVPVRLKDVSVINYGPATRRGGLDIDGAEAVGGVVVARYGANPLEAINNVKAKIEEIAQGLPSKTLKDGTISKVTIVPFYDRTGLIKETLGTLEEALTLEILISIIVVVVLVMNLRASLLISSLLPVGVLITFIVMKWFHVDANIVALSGIAIAIGVMVDVGIVFTENIIRHMEMPENKEVRGKKMLHVVYDASIEVAPAIMTALATTIVSFLPVFGMQAAEGKLFRPLAFTKTFALVASLFLGIVVLPALAHIFLSFRINTRHIRHLWNTLLVVAGIVLAFVFHTWLALALTAFGLNNLTEHRWTDKKRKYHQLITVAITLLVIVYFLTSKWLPLGARNSLFVNFIFIAAVIICVLGPLMLIVHYYPNILKWCLRHKWKFLVLPFLVVLLGLFIWQGFNRSFSFLPRLAHKAGWELDSTGLWMTFSKAFPGVGREFMPSLNEGSFLLMPTTMPHSGVEENITVIGNIDRRIDQIPEIESVVGKWGRVNSALDPAPISMFENIINYKPEYILDENGYRRRFKTDRHGAFILTDGETYNPRTDSFRDISPDDLVPDKKGEYFRQWRPQIHTPDDIWDAIVQASSYPGLTSAPKLQPIQTRLVMLQTGMRAPMGIKVFGPDLETIERFGLRLEELLKQVPDINPSSVFADRVVGKPYLEIKIDRRKIARYGLTISDMQSYIGSAVGGMVMTTTVEGRERFPVRVRYAREFRDNPGDLKDVLIPTPTGVQVPLGELADITYTRGPQMIKSEDTFLVGYVIFDKAEEKAEVDVVNQAEKFLKDKTASGELTIPPGVRYKFTGNYENQVRAMHRLVLLVPLSLLIIFLILYFQFRSVLVTGMIFSGIFVAFAGGFLMIWLYGQGWFMNFSIAGVGMRSLFQMHTINLSVAVWVGFIALFGISTDDGVIMGTYLMQVFNKKKPDTVQAVRDAVVVAGRQRVRPAMMTAACAIIALIPVLTSTGKGADIMVPMAIPAFGGMLIQVMTMFVVPILYSMREERKVKKVKTKIISNENQ
jgi:Cu(I)/Ag(I) efflux system membrane protein CusA/SilA